jgi:hypothetical protein
MPKKTTIKEAIRVVGHLLETNGTTKVFARNAKGKPVDRYSSKACKFCLSGACDVIAVNVLGISEDDYDGLCNFEDRVRDLVEKKFSYCGHISFWDGVSKEERKALVEALKNA